MNDEYTTLRSLMRDMRNLTLGCHDGYCRMHRRGGQHTNGGCRCIERLAELALEVAAEADRVKRYTPTDGTVMP